MSVVEEGTRRRLLKDARKKLHEFEANLVTRRRVTRCYLVCLAGLAAAIGAFVVLLSLGGGGRIPDEIEFLCIVVSAILIGVLGGVWVWASRSKLPARVKIEVDIEETRDGIRFIEAGGPLASSVSQRLYKADIPSFVEQFQKDGERYRRRHNRLQSIVIVGSLSTTTIASLGPAVPAGRWLTVAFSFGVGLAAGFMGYFKFRERSFYLQQTADAIEAEDNAMTLRIGDYASLQDTPALAKLVERVENIRNEQRRRQQQLDQPVEGHSSGSLIDNGPAE